MDQSNSTELKSGYLFSIQKGILGTKAIKKWCSLHVFTTGIPSYLQLHDSKEKLSSPKTIDLDKIVSVEKLKTEQGFEVCMKKEKHIFRCEDSNEEDLWIQALSKILRLKTSEKVGDRTSVISRNDDSIILDDNMLYESLDAPPMFRVTIDMNETAETCQLQKDKIYFLAVNKYNIALLDYPSKTILYQWPYQYIRRFGRHAGLFLIFSGRRCPSGAGEFNIITDEGDAIFEYIRKFTQTQRSQGMDENQDYQTDAAAFKKTQPKSAMTVSSSEPPSLPPQIKQPVKTEMPSEATTGTKSQDRVKKALILSSSNSSSAVNEDFKHELGEKLIKQSPSVDETKPVYKGSIENNFVGEAHCTDFQATATNPQGKKTTKVIKKDKEREKREEKEKKEREKQEEKRLKEEKKKDKDKKKGKDKAAPPPVKSKPDTHDPSPVYEEMDELAVSRHPQPTRAKATPNLYEDIDDGGVRASGAYAEASNRKVQIPANEGNGNFYSNPEDVAGDKSQEIVTYAEPEGKRSDAWRQYGGKEDDDGHVEDYVNIKMTATEFANYNDKQYPVQDDYEDETYDTFSNKTTSVETENIYGMSSGKVLHAHSASGGYEEAPIKVSVKSLSDFKKPVLVLEGTEYLTESTDN
ncbi:docking protein 1 [Patella vulgata]|uniref:docking protein 1 n=1 Tax=Patella vulgata TaxID=6465 RepID=UPI00217F8E41|nr:docking protein 1 [Patella vulgata]